MNLQVYSLLLSIFTMRFIPLILAAATATLFNVYAYAKPVTVSSLDSQFEKKEVCEGFPNLRCATYCIMHGDPSYTCPNGYVPISSNKFVLRLTI